MPSLRLASPSQESCPLRILSIVQDPKEWNPFSPTFVDNSPFSCG